jgi:hypothetical protein
MTETVEKTQIALRIDPELLAQIDARIALMKSKGKNLSRNQWFENMTRWVVQELPHQAVRADLIKAWPSMPPEALRIDQ